METQQLTRWSELTAARPAPLPGLIRFTRSTLPIPQPSVLRSTRLAGASSPDLHLAGPKLVLSPLSDSGILGDARTTFTEVTLAGETTPSAIVTLPGRGKRTRADAIGRFQFSGVSLEPGANRLTVVAQTADGRSLFETTIRRVADRTDPVITWNAIAIQAILTDNTSSPLAARNLAIVQSAVFDAVNGIVNAYRPYRVSNPAPTASPEAAAVAAAYETLVQLYPTQKATFDRARLTSLAQIPDGPTESAGLAWGTTIATAQLAERQTDGASTTIAYVPQQSPGQWQPSPPEFRAAVLPQWPLVTPFTLTRGDQFRPAAPPALTSRQYAEDLNQVKALGALDGADRTAEQTAIAKFWAVSSPAHWNQLTEKLAFRQGDSLVENARTFALLNLALADAAIVAWDAKYTYNRWRPIEAIRQAATDGNPRTQPQRNWSSLLATPGHPDYVSAHTTFSGAAATVLTDVFGRGFEFTIGSVGLPGRRSFANFMQAANEVGLSRLYGGIHTRSANQAGLEAGEALGNYVVQNFLEGL